MQKGCMSFSSKPRTQTWSCCAPFDESSSPRSSTSKCRVVGLFGTVEPSDFMTQQGKTEELQFPGCSSWHASDVLPTQHVCKSKSLFAFTSSFFCFFVRDFWVALLLRMALSSCASNSAAAAVAHFSAFTTVCQAEKTAPAYPVGRP